jgi:hypothetical protein
MKTRSLETATGETAPQPNEKALAVIRKVAEKQKGMRVTKGESSVDIVRRGRAGEMFDYDTSS